MGNFLLLGLGGAGAALTGLGEVYVSSLRLD